MSKKRKPTGPKPTENETRLKDAAQRMQTHNLQQQTQIKTLAGILTRVGDDLLAAGNTADQFREYWPEYRSPAERDSG
jgi:hypothetical protein